ncbi:membrane protein [Beggiatoa sp. PS]|nr:membrane protein [Beggiatoa sp. PS]
MEKPENNKENNYAIAWIIAWILGGFFLFIIALLVFMDSGFDGLFGPGKFGGILFIALFFFPILVIGAIFLVIGAIFSNKKDNDSDE